MRCCNNYVGGAATNQCGCVDSCNTGCNGMGFSCIIDLIILLIVLQFLTQIICGLQCDDC